MEQELLEKLKMYSNYLTLEQIENVYKSFLKSQKDFKFVVNGFERAEGFKKELNSLEALKIFVIDVWNHSTKYCKYILEDNSSDAYYEFLKFLWIDYDNKLTIRLGDLFDLIEEGVVITLENFEDFFEPI